MGTITKEFISIKELALWDQNARFSDKHFDKPESELIKHFCEKQEKKNFKIVELAESIVGDFDLPQSERVIVFRNSDGKNVVLEGNRRLTVFKLLLEPDLAPNEKLKEKFLVLKSKIKIDDGFKLECLVSKSEIEGFRYIERKHLNNNNEIPWGEQERTNHKKRRGSATKKEEFKILIAKFIKDLDIQEELKEQVLGPGYVTNFWRILDSSPAWKEFGFNIDENGKLLVDDKYFKEKLKVIIVNILQKKDFSGNVIDSRSLNTNKEKELYLKSITEDEYKKVNTEINKQTKDDLFGNKSIDLTSTGKTSGLSSRRSLPKSSLRNYLIPKTCVLIISEVKINNVYSELKNNLLLDSTKNAVPNAVGVLFRVFLEISIDYFWEKEGCSFKSETKLAGKITLVADYLEKNMIADKKQLKNIRTVATDKSNILAIENFHNYVHSYKLQPSSGDLKLKWDNLQEFFEIIWNYIHRKELSKKVKQK